MEVYINDGAHVKPSDEPQHESQSIQTLHKHKQQVGGAPMAAPPTCLYRGLLYDFKQSTRDRIKYNLDILFLGKQRARKGLSFTKLPQSK